MNTNSIRTVVTAATLVAGLGLAPVPAAAQTSPEPATSRGAIAPLWNRPLWNGLAWNPGFAGSHDAVSLSAYYRRQWLGIEEGPSTALVAAHSPLRNRRLALGGTVFLDRVGPSKRSVVDGSFAWRIVGRRGTLSFGLSAGLRIDRTAYGTLDAAAEGDPAFALPGETRVEGLAGGGLFFHNRHLMFGAAVTDLAGVPQFAAGAGGMIRPAAGYGIRPTAYLRGGEGLPAQADFGLHVLALDVLWFGGGWRTTGAGHLMVEYRLQRDEALGFGEWAIGYAYEFAPSDYRQLAGGTHEALVSYRFTRDKTREVSPRFF